MRRVEGHKEELKREKERLGGLATELENGLREVEQGKMAVGKDRSRLAGEREDVVKEKGRLDGLRLRQEAAEAEVERLSGKMKRLGGELELAKGEKARLEEDWGKVIGALEQRLEDGSKRKREDEALNLDEVLKRAKG